MDAALLAEISANPGDDAPRLVYADLLALRGDPRGELIHLQIRHMRECGSGPDVDKRIERELARIEEITISGEMGGYSAHAALTEAQVYALATALPRLHGCMSKDPRAAADREARPRLRWPQQPATHAP